MFERRQRSDGGRGRFRVDSDEGGFPVDGLQSVVSSFRGRLDVVVLVVREPVAEPLVVQPLLPKAEVEHGECAITSDFLVHGQEVTGDSAFSMFNLSLREEWLNNKRFCNRLSDDEDDDIEATTEGAHNRLEAVHRKSSFIGVDSETASPSI